mmetsp:Transcript_27002/g.84912  ORF Transcript_27002/g.84912 Transcript_27002/m.84912 type:complete len:370 (-) Transcript_27002:136-1245(-)
MSTSSSGRHGSLLISGRRWFVQRSRHCFPMRSGSCDAIVAQRFGPNLFTSSFRVSSSALVQGLRLKPDFFFGWGATAATAAAAAAERSEGVRLRGRVGHLKRDVGLLLDVGVHLLLALGDGVEPEDHVGGLRLLEAELHELPPLDDDTGVFVLVVVRHAGAGAEPGGREEDDLHLGSGFTRFLAQLREAGLDALHRDADLVEVNEVVAVEVDGVEHEVDLIAQRHLAQEHHGHEELHGVHVCLARAHVPRILGPVVPQRVRLALNLSLSLDRIGHPDGVLQHHEDRLELRIGHGEARRRLREGPPEQLHLLPFHIVELDDGLVQHDEVVRAALLRAAVAEALPCRRGVPHGAAECSTLTPRPCHAQAEA